MNIEPFHKLTMGADIHPPLCFNNPFSYVPHPMCVKASLEVREHVKKRTSWSEELFRGKMFGVLLVEKDRELGYLAAFSGQLNGKNIHEGFVPPIFDTNTSDYFQSEMHCIEQCLSIEERKQRSAALQDWLFRQYMCYNAKGEQKSVIDIFIDYYSNKMLNKDNYQRNASTHHIPSGTGDCCAPKLLQYAYGHDMHPLCMSEFWIQLSSSNDTALRSPHLSEIRHDGRFYPSCHGKCRPLLEFMLEGLDVEKSVADVEYGELLDKVRVIYEDEHVIVVDKPSGLLSVPGRGSDKSIADWLRECHQTDAFWFVHRLDQDTSGLLLISKDESTYKSLQSEFVRHRVKKTYRATLDGIVSEDSGIIDLSIRPDSDDPPRQIVDMAHGKRSITRWKVLERHNGKTEVELYPETGRTHQLRVHCAHPLGLNAPITGDRLYGNGKENKKLQLRAKRLEINILGKVMVFGV